MTVEIFCTCNGCGKDLMKLGDKGGRCKTVNEFFGELSDSKAYCDHCGSFDLRLRYVEVLIRAVTT